MFEIIGADDRPYGPVSADQLREWIAAGRANGQTKARRVGDSDWKTLDDFPDLAEALAARSSGPLLPSSGPVSSGAGASSTSGFPITLPGAPPAGGVPLDPELPPWAITKRVRFRR